MDSQNSRGIEMVDLSAGDPRGEQSHHPMIQPPKPSRNQVAPADLAKKEPEKKGWLGSAWDGIKKGAQYAADVINKNYSLAIL